MTDATLPIGWRYRLGGFVVLTVLSFNMLLISAISPVLPTIAAHFGAGDGAALKAQMIITFSGVGIMVGGPIAGWLGDRIGLRRMLLLSLAAYGLLGSAGLYLESATVLLASRFLQGMATAGIGAASVAMLGNSFSGGARSRLLGYQHALLAVAGAITLLVAGEVAKLGGWRAPFALYLTSFLMIGVVLIARFPEGRKAAKQAGTAARPTIDLLPMWRTFLMIVALYVAAYMFFLQLPFVMAGDGITNPAVRSRVLTAITVMMVVGGTLYGHAMIGIGAKWTLVAILGLMGAACLLVGVSHGVVMSAVACGLAGLGGGGLGAYVADMVLWQAPVELRGRATGFLYMSMYVGDFMNPWIVTPMRGAIGNHEAFAVVGILLVAGAVARWIIGSGGRSQTAIALNRLEA
ncbi:MAG: transporter [Rhodospirillales bacterium]|nr:transporter [Rhodospirillales bacterium]